jgi:hypothetical protein
MREAALKIVYLKCPEFVVLLALAKHDPFMAVESFVSNWSND